MQVRHTESRHLGTLPVLLEPATTITVNGEVKHLETIDARLGDLEVLLEIHATPFSPHKPSAPLLILEHWAILPNPYATVENAPYITVYFVWYTVTPELSHAVVFNLIDGISIAFANG